MEDGGAVMAVSEFDLHSHTTVSDGQYSPVELIDRAQRLGVRVLSITDHDSVGAYTSETFDHAGEVGIELLPGVELSTRDEDNHRFHIIGLGIDTEDKHLLDALEDMSKRRRIYAESVIELFRKDGLLVDPESLLLGSATITKAGIADLVLGDSRNADALNHLFVGRTPSRGEFIETTMLYGGRFYAPSTNKMPPQEAIKLINDAGGLAILAHPMSGPYEGNERDAHIEKILALPLDGLEAFYIYFAKSLGDLRVDEIDFFTDLANKRGLLVSAGSDFHSDAVSQGNFVELGFANQPRIPDISILVSLQEALKDRK
jgi:3',5'-nucleoside bisphosphate phosphatase